MASVSAAGLALAQGAPGGGSLLLGRTPAAPEPPPPDPALPTGAPIEAGYRRLFAPPTATACSTRAPFCVHALGQVAPGLLHAALADMDAGFETLNLVLGLPSPTVDDGARGGEAVDFYLLAGSAQPLETEAFASFTLGFDSASVRCAVGDGQDLARATFLCVAEAIAARLSPSATPRLRRGYAAHLWQTFATPTGEDLKALDDLQSNPQSAVLDAPAIDTAAGTSLFWTFLAERTRDQSNLNVPTATLALAATRTPGGASTWNNEPDALDVLRASFPKEGFRQLLMDLAVARAFVGDRSDRQVLSGLEWAGRFGRVRFDWAMPFSTLPRHVASAKGIEPSGAMYAWLALDEVPVGATVSFRAECEPPAEFQWAILRVDHEGRLLGRLQVPFHARQTTAETTIRLFEAAAGLLIVGTNIGDLPPHPLDPDAAPYEPHGCALYLALL